jgi:zinc protease
MKVPVRFTRLLAVILVAACSRFSAPAETAIPKIAVEKTQLANGLDVLMVEDHRLPRVSVSIWYHVGPVNEEPGRTGFAHLFEHMMFQKSKHVAEDAFFRTLEAAGGSDMNGTTDQDRTNYFETVPTNQLETALWLESDRMGYLLDDLTAESFKNQQDVVRNERRQSIENEPYGIVSEAVTHALFPKTHPYYSDVIGSHQDIQAAQVADVRKFFKQYYSPNNASIAIVGDIDKTKTRQLVEKYFGSLKRGPDVPAVQVTTPEITSERRVVVKDHVELPRLYMAWITPPIFKPGDAEAELAADILGQGKSSRLYRTLVYDKQIAQDVVAFHAQYTLGSELVIYATARAGHTLEEIEKEIDAQLDSLRMSGPTAAELNRAKTSTETGILFSLERNGGFDGIADRINMYNHHLKNPDYLAQDILRYRTVSIPDVQKFAAKYLVKNARAVVYGVPGEQDLGTPVPTGKVAANDKPESVNVDEAWRAKAPEPGPAPSLVIPAPVTFKLASGLNVVLDYRKGWPVVAAKLVVRSGSGANPIEKPGLANFALSMLDEGTATLSANQFSDLLEQLGAHLEPTAAEDYVGLTLTSARSHIQGGLDLLADAAMNPVFPEKEIERERKNILGELSQQKADAWSTANRVVTMAVNGEKSPFGYTSLGTTEAVTAMTQADLRGYWSEHIVPENSALIVSGDLTQSELTSMLSKTFGAWKPGSAKASSPGVPMPVSNDSRLVIVDMPGASQTELRFAVAGPPRSTPDYESLQVMNAIFGGLFSSRINLNLREKHGYTYGARSSFTYLRNFGWFTASSGVRTDVTGPATKEVLSEVRKIDESPVSDEEMKLARELLVGALPARFQTTEQTVNALTDVVNYDLGLDFYSGYAQKVTAVSKDQVEGMAKKYLIPEKVLVVAVGDKKKIEPGMSVLGLGKIQVRDPEGKVVQK